MVTCIWKCDICGQAFASQNEAIACESLGRPVAHYYRKGQMFKVEGSTTIILELYRNRRTHEPMYKIKLRGRISSISNAGIERRIDSGDWNPIV